MDKKLMDENPIGILQCVGDVILEGYSHVMLDPLPEVKCDALSERGPSLGGIFGMNKCLPKECKSLGP
jgi:hypothetical protein